MSKPIIQIGDESREMTESEFAQWQQDVAEVNAKAAATNVKAAAFASALAKLADLGLTETEIKALVG